MDITGRVGHFKKTMITYLLTHRDIDVEVLGAQAPAQIDEI